MSYMEFTFLTIADILSLQDEGLRLNMKETEKDSVKFDNESMTGFVTIFDNGHCHIVGSVNPAQLKILSDIVNRI